MDGGSWPRPSCSVCMTKMTRFQGGQWLALPHSRLMPNGRSRNSKPTPDLTQSEPRKIDPMCTPDPSEEATRSPKKPQTQTLSTSGLLITVLAI